MIDLGDTVQLPDGITAKVVGWQKMLGQNAVWCIKWWDERTPNEMWLTKEEIEAWSDLSEESCV